MLLAVLAGMLLPALSMAREKARRKSCLFCLKEIGLALQQYSADYGDHLPTSDWCDSLTNKYLMSPVVLHCPSTPNQSCSYVFNRNMLGKKWNENPDVVVALDGDRGWNGTVSNWSELPPSPHRVGYTVLFNDGHAAFIRTEELRNLQWAPQKTIQLVH